MLCLSRYRCDVAAHPFSVAVVFPDWSVWTGNPGLHGQPDVSADSETFPSSEPAGVRAAAAGLSHPGRPTQPQPQVFQLRVYLLRPAG